MCKTFNRPFAKLLGMILSGGALFSLQASPWIFQPSAWGMDAGAFEVRSAGVMNKLPDSPEFRLPWLVGLHFGFLSRAELGLVMSEGISLEASALLSGEDRWLPSSRFGFRSLIHSPEGDLFAQDSLEGELYLNIGKSIGKSTKILFGVQYFPQLSSSRTQPFWGVQQKLSESFSLDYEGFGRFNEFHHNLGMTYSATENIKVEFGLFEMMEWVFQEGKVGLYTQGPTEGESAYLQPGLYFGIRLNGIAGNHQQGSTEERLRRLEEEFNQMNEQRDVMGARLSRAEKSLARWAGPAVEIRKKVEVEALHYLDTLVLISENGASPEEVRAWQDSLLSRGEPAEDLLMRLVENPATEKKYREMSLRVMAYSAKKKFLGSVLFSLRHTLPVIRREALMALDRMADYSVIDEVARLKNDPDELVAWLANRLYEKMRTNMIAEREKPVENSAVEKPVLDKTPVKQVKPAEKPMELDPVADPRGMTEKEGAQAEVIPPRVDEVKAPEKEVREENPPAPIIEEKKLDSLQENTPLEQP